MTVPEIDQGKLRREQKQQAQETNQNVLQSGGKKNLLIRGCPKNQEKVNFLSARSSEI
uniref:Uncharacterized protein n=1 Tax=Solanum tuberosum TaxID=4113 RepID=M1BZG2_SOLTU